MGDTAVSGDKAILNLVFRKGSYLKREIRSTAYENTLPSLSTDRRFPNNQNADYGNDGLANVSTVFVVSPQVAESLATESMNSESEASISFLFSLVLPQEAIPINIPQAINNLNVFIRVVF